MASYEVRDGDRKLQFEGILLGRSSSRRGDAPRWTDISLYKTLGGSYVLEKIGRSIVTHMPECSPKTAGLPRFQSLYPLRDPDDFEYCDCVPEEYEFHRLVVEADRCWATISEEPADIIEAMRIRKRTGAAHMPRSSLELLNAVCNIEPGFQQVWDIQYIA